MARPIEDTGLVGGAVPISEEPIGRTGAVIVWAEIGRIGRDRNGTDQKFVDINVALPINILPAPLGAADIFGLTKLMFVWPHPRLAHQSASQVLTHLQVISRKAQNVRGRGKGRADNAPTDHEWLRFWTRLAATGHG